MASREFIQYSYQLERGVVKLYARINIGAAGAPTLVTTTTTSGNPSKGILSVARTAAGTYRVTFGKNDGVSGLSYDRYQRVLNISGDVIGAAVGTTSSVQLIAEQVTAAVPYIDVGTVGITTGALALVDPASGNTILLEITLKNSTV
jgi:hypothetical protein